MTMIVPVAGKTGTEILQILNSELPKGTRTTLAELVQIAGVPSVNELPSFWAINKDQYLILALECLFLCASFFFRPKGVWIVPLKSRIDY